MRSSIHALVLCASTLFACSNAEDGADPATSSAGSSGSGNSSGGSVSTSGGSSGASTGGSVNGGNANAGSGGANAGSSSGGSAGSSSGGSGGPQPSACEGVDLEEIGGSGVAPELVPGTWEEITPAELEADPGSFGTPFLAVAPSAPYTIYLCSDSRGMWKTEDGGSTWKRLGDPEVTGLKATSYLDSPSRVAVDPCDANHLYATQGVRGETQGFWESFDGGETWVRPPGFDAVVPQTTRDITTLVVDPTNFDHVLLGSHSWWPELENAGLMETTDGGDSFVLHQPEPEWNGGSIGIMFLHDPATGTGDTNTWLVTTDGTGVHRTTDAGMSWTHVGDGVINGMHGAPRPHYTSDGSLLIGGWGYPAISPDNGVSWTQIQTNLPYATYFGVASDGENLYVGPSCACDGDQYNQPIFTALDDNPTAWSEYQGGAQIFGNGPNGLEFEPSTRRLYSANWRTGVWVLRVID